MRVLVTGAGGMLGREVVNAARARGHECLGLTRAQCDIAAAAGVQGAVAAAAPEVIVNCAAWTDVDGAERDEPAAAAVNGAGAANLARAAAGAGARLVHISTDYVFAGTAIRPYVESDPTGPRTAYGRTKLAGEQAVLGASPEHAVVRTAWSFGPGGNHFVAKMLALAADGRREVAVVTDEVGSPTFTGHLAAKLLELVEEGVAGLFHAAGSGRCSRFEFARAIFVAAGLDVVVTPTSTRALGRAAARPPWSVLGSERDHHPLPSWEDGLFAYIALARVPGPA